MIRRCICCNRSVLTIVQASVRNQSFSSSFRLQFITILISIIRLFVRRELTLGFSIVRVWIVLGKKFYGFDCAARRRNNRFENEKSEEVEHYLRSFLTPKNCLLRVDVWTQHRSFKNLGVCLNNVLAQKFWFSISSKSCRISFHHARKVDWMSLNNKKMKWFWFFS